jgi:hypothetical protein
MISGLNLLFGIPKGRKFRGLHDSRQKGAIILQKPANNILSDKQNIAKELNL